MIDMGSYESMYGGGPDEARTFNPFLSMIVCVGVQEGGSGRIEKANE